MSRTSVRFFQNYDFQVVRGDSLVMPFKLNGFSPLDYEAEMDIIDPFTKKLIPMALGTTYSKKRNAVTAEGIFYNGDSNNPTGVILSSNDEIAIKLDVSDTLLLEANQTYRYALKIARSDGTLSKTIVQGAIQALRNAEDA